jgi:hypothetical protein
MGSSVLCGGSPMGHQPGTCYGGEPYRLIKPSKSASSGFPLCNLYSRSSP